MLKPIRVENSTVLQYKLLFLAFITLNRENQEGKSVGFHSPHLRAFRSVVTLVSTSLSAFCSEVAD